MQANQHTHTLSTLDSWSSRTGFIGPANVFYGRQRRRRVRMNGLGTVTFVAHTGFALEPPHECAAFCDIEVVWCSARKYIDGGRLRVSLHCLCNFMTSPRFEYIMMMVFGVI